MISVNGEINENDAADRRSAWQVREAARIPTFAKNRKDGLAPCTNRRNCEDHGWWRKSCWRNSWLADAKRAA